MQQFWLHTQIQNGTTCCIKRQEQALVASMLNVEVWIVVSIEFSPLCSVDLTNSWYQLHNRDYTGIYVSSNTHYKSIILLKNIDEIGTTTTTIDGLLEW